MTHAMDKASRRKHDLNGWFEIKGNPLSRVGVFEYSGAQIGAPADQADKIFKVYRPAEELGSAETIDSFKLVPFIDDHTMLGEGFTPTDERGISGVVGEDVYFEDGVLYGNPKVYSLALADKIKSGKTELSCGYRCRYDFTPGVFNGETYDVVQRGIRGNHLALVDEGRMGPEVSILDQLKFTVDAKEILPVEEKLAEIMAALQAISARLDAVEAKEAADEEAKAKEGDTSEDEDLDDVAEDLEEVVKVEGLDAALKARIAKAAKAIKANGAGAKAMDAALKGRLAAVEKRPAMDEASVMKAIAAKASLVERLSAHIGAFDHAAMTVQEVAAYGVAKLGIAGIDKGSEGIALDAYLQAKPAPTAVTTAEDAAKTGGLAKRIAAHAAGE